MSLNEFIVEDAALEWFHLRQGYGGQVGEQSRGARTLILAFSQREKEEVRAIRRLNPAIPEEAFANRQGILVSSKHIETKLNP